METLPIELRRRAKLLLGEKETTVTEGERPDGSRGRCYDCGRARDKTTRRYSVVSVRNGCAVII